MGVMGQEYIHKSNSGNSFTAYEYSKDGKYFILRENEIGQYWESTDEFFERLERDKKVFSGEVKVEPGYRALRMDEGYRKELILQKDGSWTDVKSLIDQSERWRFLKQMVIFFPARIVGLFIDVLNEISTFVKVLVSKKSWDKVKKEN